MWHWCLAFRVRNIGPVPLTPTVIAVRAKGTKPWRALADGWLLLDDKDTFPKVVAPGEEWEGLHDFHDLLRILGLPYDEAATLDLQIRLTDVDGRRQAASASISVKEFTAMQADLAVSEGVEA